MARAKVRAGLALGMVAFGLSCGGSDAPVSGQAGGGQGGGGQAGGGQGGSGQAGGGQGGGGGVCSDCSPVGQFSFELPGMDGVRLWTATTMDKVLRESKIPSEKADSIQLYAAKNEFESFQLVVRADASQNMSLEMGAWTGPSQAITRATLSRVDYVKISAPSDASSIPSGYVPDPLTPLTFGAQDAVKGGQNQPYWVTVRIPQDASAGDYTNTLTIHSGGKSAAVKLKLHVYDFALPSSIGFDGNWNTSFQALGGGKSLEKVQELKDFFFEHRLVPSGVAWPAGLNYNGGIDYDCASGSFKETNNAYDFSQLGPKYIDGKGWNGVGFPSFQIMQFVNNSTPRPQSFCGVDRGPTHQGTDQYNKEWSKLLAAIDAYLVAHSWANKGYYYVQNEPQNQADHDLAAFLAKLTKTAAPHLRIAVSEEPKPDIAENPIAGGHSYDLWWADLSHFNPDYAKSRQDKGEEVFWYFLYGDRPPFFNPITIDHQGIEGRISLWAAWKYRIRGFAYYSVTGWGQNPYENPRPQGTEQNGDGFLLYPPTSDGRLVSSIRWELLREAVEDFEYFRLANGGKMPKSPNEAAACDTTVLSAVSSTTSYTRDSSALQHLRNQLGLRIEGKANGWPVLDSHPQGAHARAAYYLNFQDPEGEPKANPLVVDGHEWTKIGWSAYEASRGFGWSGPYIGKPTIMLYKYLSDAPANELQKSIIYNDYGRVDTFNWDIENGRYEVKVSIGWHGRDYLKNRVIVEGKPLFDSVATTKSQPYRVESVVVDVSDGNITLEAGSKDEYTMLNWMSISPVP